MSIEHSFFPGVSKIVDLMKDWLGTCNIPTENAGGVLKVVDKEEKVVVAKEVADRILGSSVLIIGSSSYLRYWRPLRKVTPTSISMGRADLKKIMKSSLISRELYISAADVRDLKLV